MKISQVFLRDDVVCIQDNGDAKGITGEALEITCLQDVPFKRHVNRIN